MAVFHTSKQPLFCCGEKKLINKAPVLIKACQLCARPWCYREWDTIGQKPLGLMLYSKHHKCLLHQHWRTVREQIKSIESSPYPPVIGGAANVYRQMASMRKAITHKTTLACRCAKGLCLESVSSPCRKKRQEEESMTKQERKVERQKDRKTDGGFWVVVRGAEPALKSRCSKRSGWQLI